MILMGLIKVAPIALLHRALSAAMTAIHLHKAYRARENDEFAKCLQILNKISTNGATNVDVSLLYGSCHAALGDFASSAAAYKLALNFLTQESVKKGMSMNVNRYLVMYTASCLSVINGHLGRPNEFGFKLDLSSIDLQTIPGYLSAAFPLTNHPEWKKI